MGFKNPSSVSNGLKIHYEKLVYPFDVFEKEKREEMERQEAEKVKNVSCEMFVGLVSNYKLFNYWTN